MTTVKYETGVYYYGARYYDPQISVWLSVDPMSDQRPGLTPYNFVQNNPLTRVDPTGMLDEEVCTTCPNSPDYDVFRNSEVVYDYNTGSENEAGIGTVTPQSNSSGEAEVIAPKANGNSGQMNGAKNTVNAASLGKVMADGAAGSTQADIVKDAKIYSDRFKQIPSGDKLAYKNMGKLRTGLDILGKATGVASAGIAWYDYSQNPTTGNLIQATVTTALIPLRINPVTGLIIGVSDVTGFSDKAFDFVGDNIDNQLK